MTTTCQICGREIKSKSGVIAHHGYQRPGNGWQTSSCMGARHLPYEQSCDLIPVAINSVTEYIKRQQQWLDQLHTDPPAKLIGRKYAGFGNYEPIDIPRPEGFDPQTARRDYRTNSYFTLYFDRIYETEQTIRHAQNDLHYLEQRLINWKAPEVIIA